MCYLEIDVWFENILNRIEEGLDLDVDISSLEISPKAKSTP